MSIDSEITVVSGLPRSGTSLMMQMLQCGGMTIMTDQVRAADVDNPRGYFELEIVKKIKEDASWLPAARGKAFKLVSLLLYDLPTNERYRLVWMDRDLAEVVSSQEKMLGRLGREAVSGEEITRSYSLHLQKLEVWLERQPHIQILRISYNDLIEEPEKNAKRVNDFLDGRLDIGKMVDAVDPSLYRNRLHMLT